MKRATVFMLIGLIELYNVNVAACGGRAHATTPDKRDFLKTSLTFLAGTCSIVPPDRMHREIRAAYHRDLLSGRVNRKYYVTAAKLLEEKQVQTHEGCGQLGFFLEKMTVWEDSANKAADKKLKHFMKHLAEVEGK